MSDCAHNFVRAWVTEDYLYWECTGCKDTRMAHFSDLDDEDWEWVKHWFRRDKRWGLKKTRQPGKQLKR